MYGHGLAAASCSHETLPRRPAAALGQHILALYGEPAPSASARERVGPVQCKTPLTRSEKTEKGPLFTERWAPCLPRPSPGDPKPGDVTAT